MLRNLLIITCLLCVVTITFGQKKKGKKKKKAKTEQVSKDSIDYKAIGAPMPEIHLVTQDGKVYTSKKLKNKHNMIVMLFNPTCEHCHEETFTLEKNIHLINKSHVVLMASGGMMDYMNYFKNTTRYPQYPSLIVGVDSAGFVEKTFNYSSLPQINIYDAERKLIRTFNGDTHIDSLKPYIQ